MSEGISTPVLNSVKKGSHTGFSVVSAVISFLTLAAVSLLSLSVGSSAALFSVLTLAAEIGVLAVSKTRAPKYKFAAVSHFLMFAVLCAASVFLYTAPSILKEFVFPLAELISPLEKFIPELTVFDILPLTVIFALKELVDFIYSAHIMKHVKKNTPFGVIWCIVFYAVCLLLLAVPFFIDPFRHFGNDLVYIILSAALGSSIIFKFVGAVIMQSDLRKAKYVFTKEK